MFCQIFLTAIVIWTLMQRWQSRSKIKLHKQLPIDIKPLPIVGHAHVFAGSDEDRMRTFQTLGREAIKHGGLTSFWLGNQLFTVIADLAAAELVMKTCLEKDDVMRFARVIIGNGSVFAPVPIWRPRRKVLAPTFHPKNLNRFIEVFSKQSSVMVDKLRDDADSGDFPIWKYLTTYTMDSVCETNLGVQMHAQLQPDQPFLKAFDKMCELVAARMCQPWLHADSFYKLLPHYSATQKCKRLLYNFVDQIIKAKRESLKEEQISEVKSNRDKNNKKENKMKTFLEMLIESSGGNGGYSDVELCEETLVIAMAGTDTSAVGACFTILMLARHPDVQERIYEELKEVYGDSKRPITAEDMPRLKFLEAVIKEALRLYPPVPVVVRKVDKDVDISSGITLVKGTSILISFWALHRNPRYWGPDAELFKPERFYEGNLEYPSAFMPFSYGPRSCLGYQYAMLSMKTAVAALLRNYRVLPPLADCNLEENITKHAPTEIKDKPIRLKFDIMMKDVENFVVRLESRL